MGGWGGGKACVCIEKRRTMRTEVSKSLASSDTTHSAGKPC